MKNAHKGDCTPDPTQQERQAPKDVSEVSTAVEASEEDKKASGDARTDHVGLKLVMDIADGDDPSTETTNLDPNDDGGAETREAPPDSNGKNESGKVMSSETQNEYQCDVCSRVLKSARSLQNHKLIHGNVKPFECSDCGEKFRWRQCLMRHSMKTDISVVSHQCRQCELKFMSQCLLKQHLLAEKHSSKW